MKKNLKSIEIGVVTNALPGRAENSLEVFPPSVVAPLGCILTCRKLGRLADQAAAVSLAESRSRHPHHRAVVCEKAGMILCAAETHQTGYYNRGNDTVHPIINESPNRIQEGHNGRTRGQVVDHALENGSIVMSYVDFVTSRTQHTSGK